MNFKLGIECLFYRLFPRIHPLLPRIEFIKIKFSNGEWTWLIFPTFSEIRVCMCVFYWLLNVTINDIAVIPVTAHKYMHAGRTKKSWTYGRAQMQVNSYGSLKLVRTPLNVYFTAFKSYLSLSLCTYYLGWMSCLISFERCQSSCKERGTSEHYKKFLSTVGFEPPTPHLLFSSVSVYTPGYWDSWWYEIRTFTVLNYAPIL